MRIVVHAGAWKTGSSAIQAFLKQNLKALLARDVIVPPMARGPRGHARILDRLIDPDEAAAAEYLAQLRELGAGRPDAVALVSSEHIWPLREDELRRLAGRLRSVAEDVRFLLYVRAQEEMWGSLFAQEAKFLRIGAETPRWGGYHYLGGDIVDRGLFYASCLDHFRAALGEGVVDARVYARGAFAGGDVIRDFLAHIGVTSEEGLRFDRFDRNPSLGWKAVSFSMWARDNVLEALTAANPGAEDLIHECFIRSCADARRRFRDRDWVGRAPVVFDTAELREIRDHYAADNRRLFDEWFGGRDVFGPVRTAERSPLGADLVEARELSHARRRMLVHLTRAGLDAAPAARALIPSAFRRGATRAVEASPVGWLERLRARPIRAR